MIQRCYAALLVISLALMIFGNDMLGSLDALYSRVHLPVAPWWVSIIFLMDAAALVAVGIVALAPFTLALALYKLRKPLAKAAAVSLGWTIAWLLLPTISMFMEVAEGGCCTWGPEIVKIPESELEVIRRQFLARSGLRPVSWEWNDEFDFWLYGDGFNEGMLDMTPRGSVWVPLCPRDATVLEIMDDSDELDERVAVYTAARELKALGRIGRHVPLPPAPPGTPADI
jgi:hypothetical protein